MRNGIYNKLRAYPQGDYWNDTDGLITEKVYMDAIKKEKKRQGIRHKIKAMDIREVSYD